MRYLLDTSTFSALMRSDSGATAGISALSDSDQVLISVVVRGEILHGIRRLRAGKRREELESRAKLLFDDFECLPITENAADIYAEMRANCEKAGRALDQNDLWIAATALAIGATLVSRDADFTHLKGLKVVNWSM